MKSLFLLGLTALTVVGTAVFSSTKEVSAQQNAFLSCRVLSQNSNDNVQFAGSAVVWSDSQVQSMQNVPGGGQVYQCSRELRTHVCRTFGGPIIDGDNIKEGALTGAFLMGMSGSGVASGGVLGGGVAVVGGFFGSTIKTAQCAKEIEELTAITEKMSVDWPGSFADSSGMGYGSFLAIVDASRQQGMISHSEANRILLFTDKIRTLIGN